MNSSSTLFIVATPIGNLQDISLRALEVLRSVDVIAAEDTRHSRYLLDHFAITTKAISLHQHNEQQRTEQLLELLKQGKSIALISDAGTPLISDPGFHLVRAVRDADFNVVPIPGACALVTALSCAGLPTNQFIFEGFLSIKSTARQKVLNDLVTFPHTIICYEAPHRIMDLLADIRECFGEEREIAIARELTKTYETIYHGTADKILSTLENNPQQQRGEFVVLIHGAEKSVTSSINAEAEKILKILLAELPLKQAVQLASQITGVKKNVLYDWAVAYKNSEK